MIDILLNKQLLVQLFEGALVTLLLAFSGGIIGFLGGTLLGLALTSHQKSLRILSTIFVTVIRGTPLLLQIMFFYFMLPYLGIHISALVTAIMAIGINSSAYISQIIKAGIASVSKGQIEAAKTLGVSSFNITRYIILPQALRVVLPALGNEFVTLIKESSLASVIGVLELYMRGNIIISHAFNALAIYTVVGIIYLIMTTIISLTILRLENTMHHARN